MLGRDKISFKPATPSDRAFELLVQHVADYAIFLMDRQGYITTWNLGAQRIKGYRAEEIIGQHFSRFYPRADIEKGLPEKALATAFREGRFETEAWRMRRDGSRFRAMVVIDAIHDDDGKFIGFAKITRDITERYEGQQALLRAERQFRLLVEGVTDYAIFMIDPAGMIVSWNEGARRIKGYGADEVIGRHFSMFFPRGERAAGMPARMLDVARREGRYEVEARRVRKDGTEFWASVILDAIHDETGALIGFGKITRDITERRAAQNALRESERQFSLLVGGVVDYAIYMLDPNGIVTSWNAGAERIKGYKADEIIGQHFSRFYLDDDRRAGLPAQALHRALTEGKFETENWRCRKDGSMFWAHVVIDPIRDDGGNLIGYAKITRDITAQKTAAEKLASTQAQLAHAQKMEALGQLTGGVAHDFNNLLMVVQGQAGILKRRQADNPAVVAAAEHILTAVKRGADLTRQLLTFARRQPSNPEVIDFRERVGELELVLGSVQSEGLRIRLGAADDLWLFSADASELDLALLNLVVNARDAMPRGGEISVTAENETIAPGVLREGLSGDFVVLTVTDEGCGIPPDILPKIFDPFFTTKPSEKGTGLGLAQVFGFVTSSGGDVVARSQVGKGTQIAIYLPRTAAPAQQLGAEREPEIGHAEGRILLVEDNPDVANVTEAMLVELGYTVHATNSADAALRALAAGVAADLVVSDIVMAGDMDGIGLAQKLSREKPGLPVLLVSGYVKAGDAAAQSFPTLRKPFHLHELSRAVSNLLSRRNVTDAKVVPLKRSR